MNLLRPICSSTTLVAASIVSVGGSQVLEASGPSEFHFARLAFGAFGCEYRTRRGEPWLRDWPEADYHFTQGLGRLTRIVTASRGRTAVRGRSANSDLSGNSGRALCGLQ